MKIHYEWMTEVIDEFGDIQDVDFSDKLNWNGKDTLALVRKFGNDADGEISRSYAYVNDGHLPLVFSDELGRPVGIPVPKRFQKELASY